MNRAVAAVSCLLLLLLSGCAGRDEPPAGVLPPAPSTSVPAPEPSDSATPAPSESSSADPALLRPRGWTSAVDDAAVSTDPKVVAAGFVAAMFLADSRLDDGNQQPFVRAVTLFGNQNAATTVSTGPQPPIGTAWMPMRDHDGFTTVKVQIEEEPDAEADGDSYAASAFAAVTFTDGRGWRKAGGEQYLLVMLVRGPDGLWKVDDYRID